MQHIYLVHMISSNSETCEDIDEMAKLSDFGNLGVGFILNVTNDSYNF